MPITATIIACSIYLISKIRKERAVAIALFTRYSVTYAHSAGFVLKYAEAAAAMGSDYKLNLILIFSNLLDKENRTVNPKKCNR